MTSQNEVDDIVMAVRQAVASAISEKQVEKVTVEIKELSKIGNIFVINATFRTAPFLGGRSGKVYVTLTKSEQGLNVTNLKIDEKGL